MKKNGFILALMLAVFTAYFFPAGTQVLPLDTIITIGVGGIFFFYGLKLSPVEFKHGMKNYKLHILVQLTTFLLFPLLVLLFYPLVDGEQANLYWQGFFFLSVVPSTVSSSVILVSVAKGNIPGAIFNASLSGIIGVLVTPLWLTLFLSPSGEVGFGQVLFKLVLQIVFPLVLGLVLHKKLKWWVEKNRKRMGVFDKTVIVAIVYTSFSAAFLKSVFEGWSAISLLLLVGLVLAIFLVVFFGLGILSKKIGFSKTDQITAQYCGSQKSLVHGSVMVQIIYANAANTAVLLLPLMLYHFTQLMLTSYFAERKK